MSSSELSNALNPNIVSRRPRNREPYTSSHIEQVPQHSKTPPTIEQPPPYLPHRSELELAIIEPAPRQIPSAPASPVREQEEPSTQVVSQQFNAVQELVRALRSAREAAETERKRHLAWEREQEAKFVQRQADMERQMHEMQQEISVLKAYISLHPSMNVNILNDVLPSSARIDPIPLPHSESQHAETPALPATPVSEGCVPQRPQFIEGSSSQPIIDEPLDTPSLLEGTSSQDTALADGWMSETPHAARSRTSRATSSPVSSLGKRPTPLLQSDECDYSSSDESSMSAPLGEPLKRVNGHDTRCLTIQHAMRSHLLRAMGITTDKELPDSHIEGIDLSADQPVRFVWDKTPKQSPHNSQMKARVIADITAKRRRYKYVPEKDFSKKNLEAVFDQAFTTLRQKFKNQRDAAAARDYKRKDGLKALKARRLQRKKLKLANRTQMRQKLEAFIHPTFAGAFQLECVSSEESSEEFAESSTDPGTRETIQVLVMRGLPWRSSRLQRFFSLLDEEERIHRSTQPKRGVGKKTRRQGPPKDGFYMPPKGVASWMISKRWIRDMQENHPELLELLRDIIVNPEGFDWSKFVAFGPESDVEVEVQPEEQYLPQSGASYSLQNALQPVR